MKKSLPLSLLFSVLMIGSVFAQKMPFPQNKTYAGCIKPNNVWPATMTSDIAKIYLDWKDKYLKASKNTSGGYYIYDNDATGGSSNAIALSETHGYGMLIFVFMAGLPTDGLTPGDGKEKEYFDGMFKFFQSHKSKIDNRLMSWQVTGVSNETGNQNSATDGDMDIAMALLLADAQWGSGGSINYLQEAKDIIAGIKDSEINTSNNRIMLGDWWDEWGTVENATNSRSSDLMTDHFKAYYDATGNSIWNTVRTEAYSVISSIQNNHSQTTGLMPDFFSGTTPTPPDGKLLETTNDGDFYYNACRFPWRMAVDYAMYGTSQAKAACNNIMDWIISETGGDATSVAAGYKLDGSALSSDTDLMFTAPMMAAAISGSAYQSFLNSAWNIMRSFENESPDVYSQSITILSMLVASGNWWKPGDKNTGSAINYFSSHNSAGLFRISAVGNGYVNIVADREGVIKTSLYSLSGKRVVSLPERKISAGESITLRGNALANGVYLLNVEMNGKIFRYRIAIN